LNSDFKSKFSLIVKKIIISYNQYIFIYSIQVLFFPYNHLLNKIFLMQKRTPLKYSIVVKDNYVSVTVLGYFSLSDAKIMYADALETLADRKLSKLFLNIYNVKGDVKTLDRFYIGEFAALESLKYLRIGLERIDVSIYGKEPMIDPERFDEIVARNLGLNIKITTDKNKAFQFLGVE